SRVRMPVQGETVLQCDLARLLWKTNPLSPRHSGWLERVRVKTPARTEHQPVPVRRPAGTEPAPYENPVSGRRIRVREQPPTRIMSAPRWQVHSVPVRSFVRIAPELELVTELGLTPGLATGLVILPVTVLAIVLATVIVI